MGVNHVTHFYYPQVGLHTFEFVRSLVGGGSSKSSSTVIITLPYYYVAAGCQLKKALFMLLLFQCFS